ncbi:MAG: cell division protein FtsZ [Alphaproteobacteria bacterium]|nr:cell division protein FtsZ [Alphaproteobacteria bacterium]MBV9554139.1 cell division protein FtsZ [Alphaproteobacteria bacterium]
MINLSIPKDEHELKPRITVIGVGGAGGNAVNNMIRANLIGCEFIACNTDAQSLQLSAAPRKIQLGIGVTRGLGAGSRPDVGRAAAEEAIDDILESLHGSNMVFITAGMGGGTGSGAAPVIARIARESGILTVGVVTKPFHFEGVHRMRTAEAAIEELQKFVDTLIIIPNQNLFRVANERTTFADAFKMADDVLHAGVRGVTDLMVMPGLINLDFADIRTVMSEMGKAMMGTGEAEGERRAVDAAEAAISNPLLEDVSMKGARGVLINITGGLDMTLFEVDEAANRVREEVDPNANIIFGSTFDEKLQGRMRISVVATGIDADNPQGERQPSLAMRAPALDTGSGLRGGYTQPMLTQNAAMPPRGEARAEPAGEPPPAAAEAAETAAVRSGAFIAPRPVDVGLPRQVPLAHPAVPAAAAETAARPRPRGPSLIERVTGVGRARLTQPPAAPTAVPPTPAAAPAAGAVSRPAAAPPIGAPRPVQPRLAPLESEERTGNAKEDDLLDIPAFLRRQAN